MYNTGFNTIGIGDPIPAGMNTLGSGDLFQFSKKDLKKKVDKMFLKRRIKKFDMHPPLLVMTKEYKRKK